MRSTASVAFPLFFLLGLAACSSDKSPTPRTVIAKFTPELRTTLAEICKTEGEEISTEKVDYIPEGVGISHILLPKLVDWLRKRPLEHFYCGELARVRALYDAETQELYGLNISTSKPEFGGSVKPVVDALARAGLDRSIVEDARVILKQNRDVTSRLAQAKQDVDVSVLDDLSATISRKGVSLDLAFRSQNLNLSPLPIE